MNNKEPVAKKPIEEIVDGISELLLPHSTTELIIDEVMKNGRGARKKVLNILVQHNAALIKATDKSRKELRVHIEELANKIKNSKA